MDGTAAAVTTPAAAASEAKLKDERHRSFKTQQLLSLQQLTRKKKATVRTRP